MKICKHTWNVRNVKCKKYGNEKRKLCKHTCRGSVCSIQVILCWHRILPDSAPLSFLSNIYNFLFWHIFLCFSLFGRFEDSSLYITHPCPTHPKLLGKKEGTTQNRENKLYQGAVYLVLPIFLRLWFWVLKEKRKDWLMMDKPCLGQLVWPGTPCTPGPRARARTWRSRARSWSPSPRPPACSWEREGEGGLERGLGLSPPDQASAFL